MTIIISMGGGLSSTIALPMRVREFYQDNIVHVIAVLRNEHPDTWELVKYTERLTGVKTTLITYDKTMPNKYRILNGLEEVHTAYNAWDIFNEVSFLGNSRVDPCSKVLKRDTILRWIKDNYSPELTKIAVGITPNEIDRTLAVIRNWSREGYKTIFPLIDFPLDSVEEYAKGFTGGFSPELYSLGFKHNNCGGACIKAGKKQWLNLLKNYPDIYAQWEKVEREFNLSRGQSYNVPVPKYTYLKEVVQGKSQNISLQVLRLRGFKALSVKELTENKECWFCTSI